MHSDQLTGWRGRLWAFAPIVLWTGVIFFLSSPGASLDHTSRIIEPILRFLFPTATGETIQFIHKGIRKAAHVTEYSILALFVFRGCIISGIVRDKAAYLLPVAAALIVAMLDELNQSFEPSRSSSPWDVALDTGGAACMMIFVAIAAHWWRRRRADRTAVL